jgi:thiamine biosynthesis protein ThiS
MQMEILVNGASRQVTEGCTAEALVESMGLAGKRIAMEVNMEIIPRSTYGEFTFKHDDKIEIVHAVGGG